MERKIFSDGFQSVPKDIQFQVIKKLANKVIIGTEALYQMEIMLGFQNEKLRFGEISETTQMFYRREDTDTDLEMLYIKKRALINSTKHTTYQSLREYTKHKVTLNRFTLFYKCM
jgi:hypothetical protein